ncbi:MAG: hypothetical protein RIA69_20465 [Cyclobacteriaceae bacterium]
MKTISLKISDELFEKIERYRVAENLNRSSYVTEAVVAYTKSIERERLKEQLKKEAIKDKELSRNIIDELDHLSNEGLSHPHKDWN